MARKRQVRTYNAYFEYRDPESKEWKLMEDNEYFYCFNNKEALKEAREWARAGFEFGDIGEVKLRLRSLEEVDPDNLETVLNMVYY